MLHPNADDLIPCEREVLALICPVRTDRTKHK
jgi:hypothetical protein